MIIHFGLSASTASGGFASLRTPTRALITASWFSVFIISHQESRLTTCTGPIIAIFNWGFLYRLPYIYSIAIGICDAKVPKTVLLIAQSLQIARNRSRLLRTVHRLE